MKQKLFHYPRYQLLEVIALREIPFDPNPAVISISSTTDKCPEISELGLQDPERALRIKFDDIGPIENCKNWSSPRALTKEQAEEIVEFIESHLDCNFYIHCVAGVSRSGAIVRFILDCYSEGRDWETREKQNPFDTPNIYVLCTLKEIWRKKHYGTED